MSERSEYHYLHGKTATSETAQKLRDGPKTLEEAPGASSQDGSQRGLRTMTCSLQSTRSPAANDRKDRGQCKTVYYLYGDERRAVRRFIELNEEYVESCIGDAYHPLQEWDDVLWQMLLEEWDFRTAEKGGDQ